MCLKLGGNKCDISTVCFISSIFMSPCWYVHIQSFFILECIQFSVLFYVILPRIIAS